MTLQGSNAGVIPPVAYRLRRALAAFALPLLLVLASCPPDAACNLVRVAQVPLELKNHLFVLPVTINGHAIEMLLDTGAQESEVAPVWWTPAHLCSRSP